MMIDPARCFQDKLVQVAPQIDDGVLGLLVDLRRLGLR
jgi:hypothetical protein